MPFEDVREFISALEDIGELARIEKEVDWDLEAGAIVRRSYEIKAQAPFFQKLKGYPPGYRMMGAQMSNFRRIALAMGLDPDTPFSRIMEEFEKRRQHPIKPIIVDTGPCKENIHIGEDASLYEFPAPMLHDGDGGRYIGVWHALITKDKDTGWVNWGNYRQMIHNQKVLGCQILPTQDIGRMYFKYEARNEKMEFASAIGTDPLCMMAALTSYGIGKSEAELAGGLRGEPVKLVKCETVDLEVPATSEIVIEGEALPHVRLDEGPFGEFAGYRTSPRRPQPVFIVKAITHRNDPILTMCCNGIPVDDHLILTITWTLDIKENLVREGIPVTGIYTVPESISTMVVVAVETPYSNIATRVANIIWGSKSGVMCPYVVVVNSDVDPSNMTEVIHAITSKCHPGRGIRIQESAVGHPLMSYLDWEDRRWGRGANVLFDCTWPLDWPKETVVPPKVSFNTIYPRELIDKVIRSWSEYGFRPS
jgi:4-hydroxy-3-polyprenylbenzoate decarboxylase